jgi:hypothetical protein
MFPGVSTFRGHQIDGACVFIHSSCSNIVILSTFIMDLVILLLMLSGVLRWRNSRRRGGMWWLLYMQASLHYLVDNEWPFDLMAHTDY